MLDWLKRNNLNYAASATISCFQAFPHRFLPEMKALSRGWKAWDHLPRDDFSIIKPKSEFFPIKDMIILWTLHCQRIFTCQPCQAPLGSSGAQPNPSSIPPIKSSSSQIKTLADTPWNKPVFYRKWPIRGPSFKPEISSINLIISVNLKP